MDVTVTQQGANGGDEVTVKWATGTDETGVILSVAQLLQHAQSNDPWAPTILAISVTL